MGINPRVSRGIGNDKHLQYRDIGGNECKSCANPAEVGRFSWVFPWVSK